MKRFPRFIVMALIVGSAGCTSATYPGVLLRFVDRSASRAAIDLTNLAPATVGVEEESAVRRLTEENRRIFAAIRSAEKKFDLHPCWWTALDGRLRYESYRHADPHSNMGQIRLAVDWAGGTIEIYENGGGESYRSTETNAFVSFLEQQIRLSIPHARVTKEEVSVHIRTGGFK